MEKLFTYGTLQTTEIQEKLFGRNLSGTKDKLIGYEKSTIEIEGEVYDIANINTEERIDGVVYELNKKDLKNADRYEGKDYKRIKIKLLSGVESYLYVRA